MYDTFYIKQHKKYLDQIREDIDDAEKVLSKSGDKINFKSFDLHDNLNETFWDKDDHLRPDIRKQLLQIAHDFYDTLDIAEITSGEKVEVDNTFDKYIKDVLFVGSLASFNYSSYADVDLHLLMDEQKLVGKNELALNILKKYFTECKNDWNLHHGDLNVEGYDCELYVQDINEENAANGIYSIMQDKWLKKPEPMDAQTFDKAWTEKKALSYIEQIDNLEEVINSGSDADLVEKAKTELEKIKDKIVQGRRDSLAAGQGEMNKHNILFKILRRSGHIEKLNTLKNKAYDILNSIETNFKKEKFDKMNKDKTIKEDREEDPIAEFSSMFGKEAADALQKYLEKRPNKTAEEVLETDEEFEKFGNWAWKHLDVDVYAKFSKHDVGTFYDRTSSLLKRPMDGDGSEETIDDVEYVVRDGDDDNYDSPFEESINEADGGENETQFKDKLILGAVDDNNTIVIVPHEPEDDSILKAMNGSKWEKDPEYSYWYFTAPMKIQDVQNKAKQFADKFEVEIQESVDQNAKVTGETWEEFVKNIEDETEYDVDSAYKQSPDKFIKLIKKDDKSDFEAEVTKYSDGTFEVMKYAIKPAVKEESKAENMLTESDDADAVNQIKAVLRRYFEGDFHGNPNDEYDPNFTAQEALDEIADIVEF